MIDKFLDCTGRVRTFRLSVYADGRFLEAVEQREGDERGMRFVLPAGPDGAAPWGEMRGALRNRLARRDLARDPRSGRLQLLTNVVRAQIESTGDEEEGPTVLIDDLRLRWADFGRLFESYEGWHLRVEIKDLDDALKE